MVLKVFTIFFAYSPCAHYRSYRFIKAVILIDESAFAIWSPWRNDMKHSFHCATGVYYTWLSRPLCSGIWVHQVCKYLVLWTLGLTDFEARDFDKKKKIKNGHAIRKIANRFVKLWSNSGKFVIIIHTVWASDFVYHYWSQAIQVTGDFRNQL